MSYQTKDTDWINELKKRLRLLEEKKEKSTIDEIGIEAIKAEISKRSRHAQPWDLLFSGKRLNNVGEKTP